MPHAARKPRKQAQPLQKSAARRMRTRKDPRDRKQELVEACIDVLGAHGHGGLTLATVAKAAGVSTALIIVHFKSKEALLIESLKWLGQSYFGALHGSQFGDSDRPADKLWRLVDAEFSESSFPPRYLAAWKTFWTETDARRIYVKLFAPQTRYYLELTTELCRRITAEGGYADHDPDIAAQLIDCTLGGLWIDMTVAATPLTLTQARRLARAQLALFFPRHFTIDGPR